MFRAIKINKVLILYSICLFTINLNAQNDILNKKITVVAKNKDLLEVLHALQSDNEINMVFITNHIPKNYKVSIEVRNREIKDVLTLILKNTNLSFKLVGDDIVIYKKKNIPAPKAVQTNIVNVINIYDTVVTVKYDTVVNTVFDTVMVRLHDTVTQVLYQYQSPLVKELSVGFEYEPMLFTGNGTTTYEYYFPSYQNKLTLSNTHNFHGKVNLKLNRFMFKSGIGVRANYIESEYLYPEYNYHYKDTTMLYPQKIPDFINEGGTLIYDSITLWVDTVYSIPSDTSVFTNRIKGKTSIYYLSIPFSVGYRLLKTEKISLYVNTGIIFQVLLGDNKMLDQQNGFEAINLNRYMFDYHASIYLEYMLSKKWSMNVAANYSGQLSPRFENAYKEPALNRFGLCIGISYYLSKK